LANATAGGRVAVLYVDPADLLTNEHLIELDHITQAASRRQCPLEVLLIGTSALSMRYVDSALDEVRRRTSVRGELATLTPDEPGESLDKRQNPGGGPSAGMFSRKASRDIYSLSLGLLSSIEAIAGEAMRRALTAGTSIVTPKHVQAAASALRAHRSEEA